MMNRIKNIAFSALLTIAAFGAITYVACNKDECKGVTCNNGGTCISGTCNCPTGYEGSTCQTKTRDRFIGTWKGSDICGSGTYSITLSINSSSVSDITALVNNPGGFGSSVTITGNITNSSTLTFTDANVGGGRILNGTMTFSGGSSTTDPTSMSFAYTVKPTVGSTDNCSGNYTKQ